MKINLLCYLWRFFKKLDFNHFLDWCLEYSQWMNESKDPTDNVYIFSNVKISKGCICLIMNPKWLLLPSLNENVPSHQVKWAIFHFLNNYVISYHVLFSCTPFHPSPPWNLYIFLFLLLIKKKNESLPYPWVLQSCNLNACCMKQPSFSGKSVFLGVVWLRSTWLVFTPLDYPGISLYFFLKWIHHFLNFCCCCCC